MQWQKKQQPDREAVEPGLRTDQHDLHSTPKKVRFESKSKTQTINVSDLSVVVANADSKNTNLINKFRGHETLPVRDEENTIEQTSSNHARDENVHHLIPHNAPDVAINQSTSDPGTTISNALTPPPLHTSSNVCTHPISNIQTNNLQRPPVQKTDGSSGDQQPFLQRGRSSERRDIPLSMTSSKSSD